MTGTDWTAMGLAFLAFFIVGFMSAMELVVREGRKKAQWLS